MPKTGVLAFDCSAAHCAAVLLTDDGHVAAQRYVAMVRGQAEALMPLLEDVLAEADVPWQSLRRIGVGTGPGNFTGIRIAVSAARGLSLGLKIPAIGVDSFSASAHRSTGFVRVTLPGPRSQLIWQDFQGAKPLTAPQIGELSELPPGEIVSPVDYTTLAEKIARCTVERTPGARPKPVYLRPADAAPARGTVPQILG